MERKNYMLTLAGRKFEMTSSESAGHIERVRFMTEEEIEATMGLDRRISFETAAAVTALRFAERVLMLEDECTRLRREKDELAERISESEKENAKDAEKTSGDEKEKTESAKQEESAHADKAKPAPNSRSSRTRAKNNTYKSNNTMNK